MGIQFIRTKESITEYEATDDFLNQTEAPIDVAKIITKSCYDCHSNNTNTPWYGQIAPISWYINDHINHGREELNFSAWGTYKAKKKDHKLEEAHEMLEKGEMPLDEYTWTHNDAKLSIEQKSLLIDWFKATREERKPKKNELRLNNGEKWEVDDYTKAAIDSMTTIVNKGIDEGRISHYIAMAQRLSIQWNIEAERWIGDDIKTEQFFYFMTPLSEKIAALENVSTEDEAIILQKDILKDLNNYHNYFE